MQRLNRRTGSRLTTALLGALAAVVVISIILFPDQAFQSSLAGLSIWWKLVFPALMPFFIMTELLIGFGVIQGIGTLLTPLMRLLFRLPGVSGWALASGLIVGFPAGAKITATLREKNLLSRSEAERLNALSHLCSPLFLITVVGVGFLHSARLGFLLAVIHYLSAILAGLLWRNRGGHKQTQESPPLSKEHKQPSMHNGASIWKRSAQSMREAYLHDGRAFGKLLGDSVTSSVQALMLIGGYMMIFSVLINVITITHLIEGVRFVIGVAAAIAKLDTDIAPQWIKALFEIHLGAYAFSQTQPLALPWQMALLSAFLGWGGLSAHAQAAGFHQKTDVRYFSFFLARSLHGTLAFVLTFALWKPLQPLLEQAEPSFLWLNAAPAASFASPFPFAGERIWALWAAVSAQLIVLLGAMLLLSLSIRTWQNMNSR